MTVRRMAAFWARRRLPRAAAARHRHRLVRRRRGQNCGTDPNASAAFDRAHNDRAATPVRAGVQTIIERSGIPRAEADQS
jgi:hypothetical protein